MTYSPHIAALMAFLDAGEKLKAAKSDPDITRGELNELINNHEYYAHRIDLPALFAVMKEARDKVAGVSRWLRAMDNDAGNPAVSAEAIIAEEMDELLTRLSVYAPIWERV